MALQKIGKTTLTDFQSKPSLSLHFSLLLFFFQIPPLFIFQAGERDGLDSKQMQQYQHGTALT